MGCKRRAIAALVEEVDLNYEDKDGKKSISGVRRATEKQMGPKGMVEAVKASKKKQVINESRSKLVKSAER